LLRPSGSIHDDLDFRETDLWVEPAADVWLSPDVDGPQQAPLVAREAVRLAWVTALQQLPPRQRACLVLMEVVGLSAEEAAETLEMSVPAVNSAAQRARRSLRDTRGRMATEDPSVTANHEAVQAFAEAFGRYDLEALSRLLRDDTTMCMPPLALWLRGSADIVAWMGGRGAGCRGSRIVATRANGAPAWAQYRPAPGGGFTPWAIVMPVARDGVIAELHFFLDTAALFPRFGLPMSLTDQD
jgi:RNA polymerase sigma-70 factor (ECF subfamily)